MHGPDLHQGQRARRSLWLFAGTAEGPALATALLAQGWDVVVRVVTPSAARAYPPQPGLRVEVGALESDHALLQQLQQLKPSWVVDATHPFAQVISARLERICGLERQGLLRLERRHAPTAAPGERLHLLRSIEALREFPLRDERLLLAIGARQLRAAIQATPTCSHFARVLDQPGSLQAARAAGLPDEHVACLRPDPSGTGSLEQALCRRWRISVVLCRQGGGRSEGIWRNVCRELGLPLLLLQRPSGDRGLSMAALLEKLSQG
jgi:precorrin-6A/cobalt-precorrin-6A reductase